MRLKSGMRIARFKSCRTYYRKHRRGIVSGAVFGQRLRANQIGACVINHHSKKSALGRMINKLQHIWHNNRTIFSKPKIHRVLVPQDFFLEDDSSFSIKSSKKYFSLVSNTDFKE